MNEEVPWIGEAARNEVPTTNEVPTIVRNTVYNYNSAVKRFFKALAPEK